MMTAHAAVLGDPIGHSRSPVLHTAAYQALGLSEWTYHALRCTEAQLPAFLDRIRDSGRWRGLSLTMPLKEAGAALVSRLDTSLGVINTIVVKPGELVGYNTDPAGILAGLALLAPAGPLARVAVLGAGGTARAVLAALAERGTAEVSLHVRSAERAVGAAELGRALGLSVQVATLDDLPTGALVVSTLPPGAADHLPVTGPLLDVVYAPWPTRYAQACATAGHAVVGGSEVLLGQAAEQVRLMTGRNAPIAAMRGALTG